MKEKQDKLIIAGKNSLIAAVSSGQPIEEVIVYKDLSDIDEIRELLGETYGVRLRKAGRDELNLLYPGGKHQGIIAVLKPYSYVDPSDLLDNAAALNETPLIVVLDGIEDPHNLGAIIRSAHQAGAHGVIIRDKRAAGITGAVIKASAGAAFYMSIALVNNISRTLSFLKSRGLFVAAADMDGEPLYNIDLKRPLAIVIGSEGKGVSRLVLKNSDYLIKVPMYGEIDSLNASAAAAVILFEAVRQLRFTPPN